MRLERLRRRMMRFMEELREELEREVASILEGLENLEELRRPMWSPTGSLEPLYKIEDIGDAYRILVDLPRANEATLEVRAFERSIELRCKLKSNIRFEEWGTRYRNVQFNEYRTTIELPETIDPKTMKVRWKRGFAEIIVKKISY